MQLKFSVVLSILWIIVALIAHADANSHAHRLLRAENAVECSNITSSLPSECQKDAHNVSWGNVRYVCKGKTGKKHQASAHWFIRYCNEKNDWICSASKEYSCPDKAMEAFHHVSVISPVVSFDNEPSDGFSGPQRRVNGEFFCFIREMDDVSSRQLARFIKDVYKEAKC